MHILIAALHRPTKPTGVCRHAANLAKSLAATEKVAKITLVVGAWQLDYFKTAFNLISPKISLVGIEIKNSSLSRNLWFVFSLSNLANQLQPDLIHLSFPIPFFKQFFSCPIVSSIHDFYPYECPENFGYPNVLFNRWFLKLCLESSDGLSCVSEITLKNLHQYFPEVAIKKETAVVYNYVDFRDIKPSFPQTIALKQSNYFILSVGQHRQNKNFDLLVQAYFELKQNKQLNPQTKLVIVGANGPETDKLQNLIVSLNLKKTVLLLSSLDDTALIWLYQNCELFVIPSSTEGFCLPLAEAIYFSSKVVCSDIPIFREIGAAECTYFNLEEKQAIQNLALAIFQTKTQNYSNKVKDSYRFTKEKTAIQCLKLYSQVSY